MKKTGKCPKCGGTEIIGNATAIDRGHGNTQHQMSVATFQKPDAFIFKGQHATTVSAWVCAACGYIEFYADSPNTIKLSNA